jgi:hypothetical protein
MGGAKAIPNIPGTPLGLMGVASLHSSSTRSAVCHFFLVISSSIGNSRRYFKKAILEGCYAGYGGNPFVVRRARDMAHDVPRDSDRRHQAARQ